MGVEAHYDLERAPDTSVLSPAVGKGTPAMRLFIFVCLIPFFLAVVSRGDLRVYRPGGLFTTHPMIMQQAP